MIHRHFGKRNRSESGQTIAFVLLVLGVFLLGVVAFSVDYSNAYFHRQTAQVAADSACTAGIMDLLANAQGNTLGNFPTSPASPPNAFLCSANATAAPCKYAALNGYATPGLTANAASNDVRISFPGTVAGVTPPPGSLAPNPFMQVEVTDRIPTWFAGLVSRQRTLDVGARAICALQLAHAPVPIIVLHPSCTQAFDVSGSATVSIVGGPSRSIQVNSNNQTCAAATQSGNGCSGSGTINLSQAGPAFNGANFGVFGTPASAPSNFNGGSAGSWTPGATPIGDPYALVTAPDPVALGLPTNPATTLVAYGVNGCPDHSTNSPGNWGCIEYHPGIYTSAIQVSNVTAIFDPGVYYITGTASNGTCPNASSCQTKANGQCRHNIIVGNNGIIRPATPYSGGTMFYLSGTGSGNYGSIEIASNAGNPGGRIVDDFVTSNATCPGASAPPSQLNLPSTVAGNVLLGQCTGGGTWLGASNNGVAETAGTIRGLIFFQDRANGDTNGQAVMNGGGGLVVSGNLYFHNLPGYNALIQLQGTPGAGTYVLGNITADSFVLSGNGGVAMALNPNAVYNILKASLIE